MNWAESNDVYAALGAWCALAALALLAMWRTHKQIKAQHAHLTMSEAIARARMNLTTGETK